VQHSSIIDLKQTIGPEIQTPDRTETAKEEQHDSDDEDDNNADRINEDILAEILKESDDEDSSQKKKKNLSPTKKDNILSEKALEEERERMQDPLEIIDRYENSSRLKEKPSDHICYLEDSIAYSPLNISRMSYTQYKKIGGDLGSSDNEKVAGRPSCIAVYILFNV